MLPTTEYSHTELLGQLSCLHIVTRPYQKLFCGINDFIKHHQELDLFATNYINWHDVWSGQSVLVRVLLYFFLFLSASFFSRNFFPIGLKFYHDAWIGFGHDAENKTLA
jgi:hypothetical protein